MFMLFGYAEVGIISAMYRGGAATVNLISSMDNSYTAVYSESLDIFTNDTYLLHRDVIDSISYWKFCSRLTSRATYRVIVFAN